MPSSPVLLHNIISFVACPQSLCCCIYTALVSLLFGTIIPTSFNILMECFIHLHNISLWPAVVEDIEVTLGYVHITLDTNGEEDTLEFIDKEKEIHTEKVTKDYYKLDMSATCMWLE